MPITPQRRFYEYGIMLHKALTGDTITPSDYMYPNLSPDDIHEDLLKGEPVFSSYTIERQILKAIEDGNRKYDDVINKLYFSTEGSIYGGKDYIMDAKNVMIVFCTQCTEAAMRGGLIPNTAYCLLEHYIRICEQAQSISEVTQACHPEPCR